MEDKQIKQYPFFQKIGAFSVNVKEPRSSLISLKYATESMQRPGASLFIYPEGEIGPFTTKPLRFKKGLGWISNRCPGADVVPIGIYITTARYDKPELFIRVGRKVVADHSFDSSTLNEIYESEMQGLLKSLCNDAHDKPANFEPI